jgi:hypothetical protein
MTNTSSGEIDCTRADSNSLDTRYVYDIRDSSGRKIEQKRSAHPELDAAGSFRFCTLRSRQSTNAEENLISRLFDMSKPGTYTVQVSRGISSDEKKGAVKSNQITITVTP